jgi:hypothetical protein
MQSGPRRIAEKMQDAEFVASLPKSREEARQLGNSIYLTKPCKHGHNSYRTTSSGKCMQCSSDYRPGKERSPGVVLRKNTNWNSSEKAKSAKDKWKQRNPKWAWVVSAVGGARTRAKYKGLDFDLTNDYVYALALDVCPVFGVDLSYGGTTRQVPNSASLDRINPSLGYVQGNVAVISFKANTIKSNANRAEIYAVFCWLSGQEEK